MKTYKTVAGLQRNLAKERLKGKTIGFVPTMGALHEGHMSLIGLSAQECDITVCSIFVNPTQFNDKDDLKKYPRTLERDSSLLDQNGCAYLFAPNPSQVYPDGDAPTLELDLSALTQYMEGPNRPGHFEGVVQVVHRLLEIVHPDKLYMGQKDFQQFTIIAHMLKTLKMHTRLRVCPIIREEDGLAMSSRNVRLTSGIRKQASILHKALQHTKEQLSTKSIKTLQSKALEMMSLPDFEPEYFQIVDGHTLEPIENAADHSYIVACTAVWAGEVRLIDNMILKGSTG